MSRYTFTFKKDDIFVEFTSEDKDVIERQFQIWVNNADQYVKEQELRKKVLKAQTINNLTQPKPILPIKQNQPQAEIQQKIQEQTKTQMPYSQPQVNSDYIQAQADVNINREPQPQMQQQVVQPAPAPVYQEPQNVEPQQEVQQPTQPEEPKETINSITNGENKERSAQAVAFDTLYEQKIEKSDYEPQKTVDKVFMNLINSKNTKDKFHYLMITAYYLTEFEKQDRFTLKQINSKLMQNVSDVIDHSMLQEAINQGFIEHVPDLTGISDVAEYRLTHQGEEFFAYRI